MKLNIDTIISGEKVVLCPYCREHVDTYHKWMKDPYILEMTASEPLSFQEECEMQQSWAEDPKKCTFIVSAKDSFADNAFAAMIGDVNLFLNDRDDPSIAEIEVMIAEEKYRGQGCAKEALLLMMHFGVTKLGIRRFYAKINETNAASIALFKKLGFAEVNYVAAFKEYEFDLMVHMSTQELNQTVEEGATTTTDDYSAPMKAVMEFGQSAVYGLFNP